MSTYPDILLMNTSGRTITSFIVMLKSKVDRSGADGSGYKHVVLAKNLSVPSGGTYTFPSKSWVLEDKVTVQKDDGTFRSVMRTPGLDSAKSWLPGSASDLHVTVSMVVFDDGSQWTPPDNFDW
jgi:hypothetical protein